VLKEQLAANPHASSSSSSSRSGGQSSGAQPETKQLVYNARKSVYYVGAKLGQGNFGIIHNATDGFGRDFVIKVLKTNRSQAEARDDWAKETKFLYSLSHPNIIQLYDSFEYGNLYYMVMERASGNMRAYVKEKGPMPGPDVIDCAGQILSGLEHIHVRDIIHRDLHIDNILYAPGRYAHEKICIKISDFGISKLLKNDFVLGGPAPQVATTFIGRDYDYAPELVMRGHTTKQSDIYQIGLCLFWLYKGSLALSPKDGSNVPQLISGGLAAQRAKQLGTRLGNTIATFLAVLPEERPANCTAAWSQLATLLKLS
jgi:serine/threonine protein kinase